MMDYRLMPCCQFLMSIFSYHFIEAMVVLYTHNSIERVTLYHVTNFHRRLYASGSHVLYALLNLIHCNNVTLSAKSSLILGENKAGFPRGSHVYGKGAVKK